MIRKYTPFHPYLIKEAKDVGDTLDMSLSQADKPIEKGREGYFNDNDGRDGIGLISDTNNYEQTLLWVHQSKWQQELLASYGNTILMLHIRPLNMILLCFLSVSKAMLVILWWQSLWSKMRQLKGFLKLWLH